MTADQLTRTYIEFFVSKGHAEIPSASLVPENDPSVLFTTAGMHPLVPYLKGEPHPAGTRLVNVQKCLRTGDIDEVGDDTHLTFFEMLGNWSLGDYFKKEAIKWSFEFLTQKLGIDISRLAVSVFVGDDAMHVEQDTESFELWRALGIPEERIAFLGTDDNWWPAGGKNPGPQGPDTEMFYWTGDTSAPAAFDPKDSRWVEIWNDVFMEFDRQADGMFVPLKQKNVDTGMGLERTTAVLQSKSSVYDTERFTSILEAIEQATRTTYNDNQRAMRIIADHLRTSVMLVSDGVRPSNKDQGYVLRRLIRRAARQMSRLCDDSNHLQRVTDTCIDTLKTNYPNLTNQREQIRDVINAEAVLFEKTLSKGLRAFEKMFASNGHVGGEEAFKLFSTYGFPLELTEELVREKGTNINSDTFTAEFQKHQDISRAGSEKKFSGGLADHSEESKKLHTATHLLHQALRTVLGNHVAQKGSNITQERLRFDFSHDTKLTDDQKWEVEAIVNEQIAKNLPVSFEALSVEEAKQKGAIGLFEDTYAKIGGKVKVYTVGSKTTGVFSREICGGPHVDNTGVLMAFAIIKEEASSVGVRRIKAVVGKEAERIIGAR
ncbi:MAG: alanine--tRNA ligase, partial [Patescibacteria group bacterium]